MKEDRDILCVRRFEACHKPVSILKCQRPIHKCIINSKCIRSNVCHMVLAWYLQNNCEAAEEYLC